MLSTTVKESTIENLNDEVMLNYVIFADENFSLPIQKKSTLYYFIHCRFISWSMKVTKCLVLVSEYRIQLSKDMNKWMVHMKNKRYLFIWPSPLFSSISGNCFIRTVVLTVFDKNGLFDQCCIYFSENHLNNDHHLTTRNTNDLQRG